MDVYQAIAERKTIRDFAPREIDMDIIRRIIGAGFQAPSNNHLREWHFVILQDKAKRKEILEKVIKPQNEKASIAIVNRWGMTDAAQRAMYIDAVPRQLSMLVGAGCLMYPCFRQESPLLKPKNLSALNAFASIWACIENMLVAAAAEGIFGVTRIPDDKRECPALRQFLGIPEDYMIPCHLALGYPAENARRTEQTPVDVGERIHIDSWL